MQDYFRRREIPFTLGAFPGGEELLAAMDRGFDLVFLDVYLGGDDGLTVARRIRELDRTCVIIFATNSSEHAIRGYGVRALQYLLKPVGPAKLSAALDQAVDELSARQERGIQLSNRQGSYRLPLGDLIYAESEARVVIVHTRSMGDIRYYDRLDHLQALCDDRRFLRCHKSFLVNLDYVRAIVNDRVRMESGQELPISGGITRAKESFASYVAGGRGRPARALPPREPGAGAAG